MSGGLEILSETTMVEIPRGDREELRLTFVKARTADGKDVAWHSIRVFYRDESGTMRPGKAGITIRGRELRPIAEALSKVLSGGRPAPPASREPRHDRPQRSAPARPAPAAEDVGIDEMDRTF